MKIVNPKIRLIFLALLAGGLYLIVSFSRDLWSFLQKEGEIQKANLSLEKLNEENQRLERQLQLVQTPGFIEKEAREKLGLSREGETTLILPENLAEKIGLSQPQVIPKEIPNWEKWRRLFF